MRLNYNGQDGHALTYRLGLRCQHDHAKPSNAGLILWNSTFLTVTSIRVVIRSWGFLICLKLHTIVSVKHSLRIKFLVDLLCMHTHSYLHRCLYVQGEKLVCFALHWTFWFLYILLSNSCEDAGMSTWQRILSTKPVSEFAKTSAFFLSNKDPLDKLVKHLVVRTLLSAFARTWSALFLKRKFPSIASASCVRKRRKIDIHKAFI